MRVIGNVLLTLLLVAVIWLAAVAIVTVALDDCGFLPFLESCTDGADSDTLMIVILAVAAGLSIATIVWRVRRARRGP